MRLLLFCFALLSLSVRADSNYIEEYNRLFDLLSKDAERGQEAIRQSTLINKGTLQSKAIDSLLSVYINHPTGFEYYDLPSEVEINELANISEPLALRLSIYRAYNFIIMGNFPSAFELIDAIIAKAKDNYPQIYIDARFAKSQFYSRDDFYDQALNELSEIVPLSVPMEQRSFKADGFTDNILLWFGLNLGYKGMHQRAIEHCSDSVEYFETYSKTYVNNNYYLLALDCLSRNFIALENYQQAINYINRYKQVAQAKGDKGASFYINVFMAQLYTRLNQPELASLAVNQAKQFISPIVNQQDWFDLQLQQVKIELMTADFVSAQNLASELEQQLPVDNKDWRSQGLVLYSLMADIYAQQEQFESAFRYLNYSLEIKNAISESSTDSMSMASYFNNVISHQKTKLIQQQAQLMQTKLDRETAQNIWLTFLASGLVVLAIALIFILRKLKKQNLDIKFNAVRDNLTSVLNRQGFYEAVSNQRKLLKRQQQGGCLCLIDLDHFKRINDTYGHDVGDDVLKWFGHNLRAILRESDIYGRYGGEEFIIFCPNTDVDGAKKVIEKLRQLNFTSKQTVPQLDHAVTFSAGISPLGPDCALDDIIKQSDQLLYQSKREGRDRISTADALMVPSL